MNLIFQSLLIFFGLHENWRENFLEECFNLQLHLKMSYDTIYSLPVRYRKWYVDRLIKHFKERFDKKESDTSKPINNQNKLEEYENMIQNKFGK